MKKYLNSKGLSLVEMMFAIGLMGVVSLGVTKLFQNANKAAKNISTKDEVLQMHRELTQVLSSPVNCLENLAGKKEKDQVFLTGVNVYRLGVRELKFPTGNLINEREKTYSTHIESATIHDIDANGSHGQNVIITLRVKYKKTSNTESQRSGANDISYDIKLVGSLCDRKIVLESDLDAFNNACQDPGDELLDGPFEFSSEDGTSMVWGTCESCANGKDPTVDTIKACVSS